MNIRNIFAVGISLMILVSGCAKAPGTEVNVISTPEDTPDHWNTSSLKIAPDFSLPDSEGNMVQLADELQNNEQVVLVFYYTYLCTPCMNQLRDIQNDYAEYEEKGAQVFAIAVQSGSGASTSADMTKVEYPILADSDHIVAEAYGVFDVLPEDDGLSTPSVFVIDKEGNVVWNRVANSIYAEGVDPGFPTCGGKRVPSETILENLLG
jgi:peroxiredoxin